MCVDEEQTFPARHHHFGVHFSAEIQLEDSLVGLDSTLLKDDAPHNQLGETSRDESLHRAVAAA